MTIKEVKDKLGAEVFCGEDHLETEVLTACASDMMSDVLAFVKDQAILITGLLNAQVIRTAVMMDMVCVVFVRSKKPTAEMIELAKESGIAVLVTSKGMYDSCGTLYTAGLGVGASNV